MVRILDSPSQVRQFILVLLLLGWTYANLLNQLFFDVFQLSLFCLCIFQERRYSLLISFPALYTQP